MKIKILFYFITALLYFNSYAQCISKEEYISYDYSIAEKEAYISNIPQYKAGVLLDKYGTEFNKIKLINAYKKAHMKDELSPDQVDQINQLENMKKAYLSDGVCKS